jgi:hypothetical protein
MEEKDLKALEMMKETLKGLGYSVIEFDVNQRRFDKDFGPRVLISVQAVRKAAEDQKST